MAMKLDIISPRCCKMNGGLQRDIPKVADFAMLTLTSKHGHGFCQFSCDSIKPTNLKKGLKNKHFLSYKIWLCRPQVSSKN